MKLELKGLKEIGPLEWGLRFLFGGAICAGTGLLGHAFGPRFGGLFLAFPAILPASLTLLMRHRGRRASVDDGSGATAGAAGLAAFGAVVWKLAERLPPAATLSLATLAWALVSLALWKLALADRERAPGKGAASGSARSNRR